MTKREIAIANFNSGMNCAQAVALSFLQESGMSEDLLKKASIGFGGGLGRQRLVCGAVSGMCMVLSLVLSDGKDKLAIYSIIQEACAQFKKECGSLICAELLEGVTADNSPVPEKRTASYYKKRPCGEICGIAAEIAEKFLNKK